MSPSCCRFAFTALKPPQPFTRLSAHPLAAAYPQLQDQMCAAADAWRADAGSSSAAPPETFCLMAVDAAAGAVSTAGLGSWQQLQQAKSHSAAAAAAAGEVLLVMFDPCCEPLTPGWLLRNALLLAAVRWGVRRLKVLCVRDSSAGRAKAERCFVVEVRSRARRLCLCIDLCMQAHTTSAVSRLHALCSLHTQTQTDTPLSDRDCLCLFLPRRLACQRYLQAGLARRLLLVARLLLELLLLSQRCWAGRQTMRASSRRGECSTTLHWVVATHNCAAMTTTGPLPHGSVQHKHGSLRLLRSAMWHL